MAFGGVAGRAGRAACVGAEILFRQTAMNRLAKLHTLARLGVPNLLRVGAYRAGMRLGVHPVQKLAADTPKGPFLRAGTRQTPCPTPNRAWDDTIWHFGWHKTPLEAAPPDWFANPFADAPSVQPVHNWWQLGDFDNGDIKGIWELSRFDWLIAWASLAGAGDTAALDRLNHWLVDWTQQNPPYLGPNWKCGQESSIRVMHLAVAAWILGQDQTPLPGLVDLLALHLRRIAPTMSYAIGQQNNHGTSEAAALFIGGSLLEGHVPQAGRWAAKGRHWLENRARALIEPDGSFSQYSVTYHRVMLDTYSVAEAWRRHRGLSSFSDDLHARLRAAGIWLEAMTDPDTGDAPNIGANDGARLFPLSDSDYRDFRPSVQLAAAAFQGRDVYGPGPWDSPRQWLELPAGHPGSAPDSISFDDGGYHVLKAGSARAVLRYPRFRFRPGQADALHLDLWQGGRNLIRDAGTFSYNAPGAEWYGETAAHSTIAFDGRSQMPRLGRFLFGAWLAAEDVETVRTLADGTVTAAAGYRDAMGARHHRRVELSPGGMTCTDTVGGTFDEAVLRWRLAPGDWSLQGHAVHCGPLCVEVLFDGKPVTPTLEETYESRYYQQQTPLPQISVPLSGPGIVITKVTF